jgi:iron complex transport system ATP-binding protein
MVEGVTFNYTSVPVLDGVSFDAHGGEVIGIIGHNGCGKTTMLKCINLALHPGAGIVKFDGKDTLSMSRKDIAKEVGVVAQNTVITFPFTVLDMVLMGRFPSLERFANESKGDLRIAMDAMEATSVTYLASRPIDEISGGERQRVIIARALAQQPRALLLDEPTLHLDINHQFELMELIRSLAKDKGLLVIIVSHDLNLAARYCDKLIALDEGKIAAAGSVGEVLTPENLARVFNINADVRFEKRVNAYEITILGTIPRKSGSDPL